MQWDKRFADIYRYYARNYRKIAPNLKSPYRPTPIGIWATSRPAFVFSFFKKLHLERTYLFIDLGSGDGIIVAIASLFTRAVGIERDPQLARLACRTLSDLYLDQACIVCADYRTQNIDLADVLYIYPDKPLSDLCNLLYHNEWGGNLWVYGPHFPPDHFIPTSVLTMGRDKLTVYRLLAHHVCNNFPKT